MRVGEHRLVAFVVTKAAIAEDVEDHVFVEFLAELGGHFRGMHHGLWIIAIDVEDRCLDHQRDVRGIGRGAREMRRGGKADLVVHHDMDRATGAVTAQTRQAETFGHNALTGKSRIAMQQDRHHRGAFGVFVLICLARTLPKTTGFTASRCEGFAVKLTGGPCCRQIPGPRRRRGGISHRRSHPRLRV